MLFYLWVWTQVTQGHKDTRDLISKVTHSHVEALGNESLLAFLLSKSLDVKIHTGTCIRKYVGSLFKNVGQHNVLRVLKVSAGSAVKCPL